MGVASSLSLPLTAAEDIYGALNLYARTTGAFDDADVHKAEVFASYASVVLANASA
jgi:transcriptional regulator with GAF, ATPase, and Fis domain